jgi:hypothetical protein
MKARKPVVTKIPAFFKQSSNERAVVSPLFSNRRLTPKCNQSPIKFIRELVSPEKSDLSVEEGCITFRPDENSWVTTSRVKRFPHEVFRVKARRLF